MPKISSNSYEVRYVLDVGSSNTKTMSCLVDTKTNKIVKVLDQFVVPFNYQSYISKSEDGHTLSQEAMFMGRTALASILEHYDIDGSGLHIKCAGIATAWARNAHNSQEYLDFIEDSLGIHIDVVSQEEEGMLGIQAMMASPKAAEIDTHDVIVWDIGGGSFQLSYVDANDSIKVYNGGYGALNFGHEVRQNLGVDANTMLTKDQVRSAIDMTKGLVADKLKESEYIAELQSKASVYGIGQFMNAGIKPIIHSDKVTRADLVKLIEEFSEHSADELIQLYPSIKPEFVYSQQTNLILVHGIMEAVGIEEIDFYSDAQSLHAIAVRDGLWEDTPVLHNFQDWCGTEFIAA